MGGINNIINRSWRGVKNYDEPDNLGSHKSVSRGKKSMGLIGLSNRFVNKLIGLLDDYIAQFKTLPNQLATN